MSLIARSTKFSTTDGRTSRRRSVSSFPSNMLLSALYNSLMWPRSRSAALWLTCLTPRSSSPLATIRSLSRSVILIKPLVLQTQNATPDLSILTLRNTLSSLLALWTTTHARQPKLNLTWLLAPTVTLIEWDYQLMLLPSSTESTRSASTSPSLWIWTQV